MKVLGMEMLKRLKKTVFSEKSKKDVKSFVETKISQSMFNLYEFKEEEKKTFLDPV